MNWECPYTEKPTMVESCRNIRASSPPVGMQGDSLSLCRECTKELPGDEETSTCAFSQTDPLEVEEVMESVEKNNGGAQASPVIFSPSAERIAAKSSSHRTRKGAPILQRFETCRNAPSGPERYAGIPVKKASISMIRITADAKSAKSKAVGS